MNKIATSINAGENTLINQPCKIIHNCLTKSIHIHLFKLHKYYFSHLYCLSADLDSQKKIIIITLLRMNLASDYLNKDRILFLRSKTIKKDAV